MNVYQPVQNTRW